MIPRIVHQIWKNSHVPAPYRHWSSSWQRLNPKFEYRLWTYSDIERFIDSEFPEYRNIFYGYKNNISRIDLARYLILNKLGGLYVDMDFECLRPHDDILSGKTFVLGSEPASHVEHIKNTQPEIAEIACNAWIGSAPQHPFWDHFLQYIKYNADKESVLEATGPLVLSRAISDYGKDNIYILNSELLYPIGKEDCWSGKVNDIEFLEKSTRNSYAIHYWDGSWFRPERNPQTLKLPGIVSRTIKAEKSVQIADLDPPPNRPLISCLMVTRGRPDFVRNAVNGYLSQTYSNTELIVVTNSPMSELSLVREEYNDPRIRWKFIDPAISLPLGALRNISIDAASGDYIANWDDDDLYDPSRLAHQLRALLQTKSPACMLMRWLVWWPGKRRIFISHRRPWEGSLLCRKEAMPRYPEIAKAEDTFLIRELMKSYDVTLIDIPRLYVYVYHGDNTWHDAHFEYMYKNATADFSGEKYDRILQELARRVDIGHYPHPDIRPSRC